MSQSLNHEIATWDEFKKVWDGVDNFAMGGKCIPPSFSFPAIERIVDELRKDEMVKVRPGIPGRKLQVEDMADSFRKLPLDEALNANFGIAHFKLSQFDHPGLFLHGFEKQVLIPWKEALTANGFTWDRCYPICFISGKGCATNYHMDFSHVLAWQIHGTKRFCGLKDPLRWADRETRLNYKQTNANFEKPEELTEEDSACFMMKPGTHLWNTFLTPHWVEAGNSVAMSINISHGGLRLNGKLCLHEIEVQKYREKKPETAPHAVQGTY